MAHDRKRRKQYRKIPPTWIDMGRYQWGIDQIPMAIWICIHRTIRKRKNNKLHYKYITKLDKKHKDFIPTILCSAGIGAGYLNRKDSELNKFKGTNTNETYRLRNGTYY